MSNVVITGANRGIGLGLAKVFADRGDKVYGVCRNASSELDTVCEQIIDDVDVSDAESRNRLKEALENVQVDILINNAGILRSDNLSSLSESEIRQQFEVNSLAPLMVTSTLLPLIKKGGKVIVITSRMGSIGDNGSGGYYGYRMSKAAVNAGFVSLARDLSKEDIAVGILHPGMVATEMTGRSGIPVEESVAGLVQRVDALSLKNSGKFYHQSGEELPW